MSCSLRRTCMEKRDAWNAANSAPNRLFFHALLQNYPHQMNRVVFHAIKSFLSQGMCDCHAGRNLMLCFKSTLWARLRTSWNWNIGEPTSSALLYQIGNFPIDLFARSGFLGYYRHEAVLLAEAVGEESFVVFLPLTAGIAPLRSHRIPNEFDDPIQQR